MSALQLSHTFYVSGLVGAGVSAFAVTLAHATSDAGVFPGGVVMVQPAIAEECVPSLCAEMSISHHTADSAGMELQRWCQRRAQPALLVVDVERVPPARVLAALLPFVPDDCAVSVMVSCSRNDDAGLEDSVSDVESVVLSSKGAASGLCIAGSVMLLGWGRSRSGVSVECS